VGACSPFNPSSTDQNIADTKIEYDTLAACGAMLYAESQNEPNNEPFWYQCNQCSIGTSFLPCAKYQRDLYQLIHYSGDPLLTGKSVVGMSEIGSEPDNVGLQFLTIPSGSGLTMPDGTVYADYANSHGYVQGAGGAGTTPIDNQARLNSNIHDGKFNADGYNGLWDVWGEYWGLTWAHQYAAGPDTQNIMPKVVTETGWNIYKGGQTLTCDGVGRLLTSSYLDNYQLGWSYTFVYMMFNQPNVDDGWCVFNPGPASNSNEADAGNALGTASYLHNLAAILADTSSNFTPVAVPNPVVGMPATGYFMPIEKSNGTMEYVIWGEAFNSHQSTTVTVNLPGSEPTVNVYDITSPTKPNGPPNPVSILNNVSSLDVTMSDNPIVIEFGMPSH
jgi:hypothetical protein